MLWRRVQRALESQDRYELTVRGGRADEPTEGGYASRLNADVAPRVGLGRGVLVQLQA